MWALLIALVLLASPGVVLAGAPPSGLGHSPIVVRANVDPLEPDRLVIRGVNFGVAFTPIVLLAQTPLEVVSFNDGQIVAKLPIDAPPARYRLQVLAHGMPPSPVFEVILGPRPGRRSEG